MTDPQLIASIDDTTTGRWQITTVSGTRYVVDLDERSLLRRPGGVDLRRDHEPVQLYGIIQCFVGGSTMFLIQVRDDDVPTVRISAQVLSIEPL